MFNDLKSVCRLTTHVAFHPTERQEQDLLNIFPLFIRFFPCSQFCQLNVQNIFTNNTICVQCFWIKDWSRDSTCKDMEMNLLYSFSLHHTLCSDWSVFQCICRLQSVHFDIYLAFWLSTHHFHQPASFFVLRTHHTCCDIGPRQSNMLDLRSERSRRLCERTQSFLTHHTWQEQLLG